MALRPTHRIHAIAFTALLSIALTSMVSARSRTTESVGSPSLNAAVPRIPSPLTLAEAVDLARIVNPDARVARANTGVARADSVFARVHTFNPELELQTSQSLGPGSDGTLDLVVSQELELWGKRNARQAVATARSRTSAAEWNGKLQEIESEVRARFERALFFQERQRLLDDLADLDRRVVLATQARVRDGSVTPLTGRLTELDLLRLEAQSSRARSARRQALVALGLAIGIELTDSIVLNGEMRADSLHASEDSVVALALRVRGEGDILNRRIDERSAELHLAEREARPNITLGAGLMRERRSFARDDFSGDPAVVGNIAGVRSTDNLWTARVSAPLPLWQRNQASRARASAEIVRGRAEYDRYRLRTRLEVLGAARRFEDAVSLYRVYLERSTRVRQDLVLIREAYADGRISLDTYLTQKGRLVDTLVGQLETGDAYWEARGALEAAVGMDLTRLNAGGAK